MAKEDFLIRLSLLEQQANQIEEQIVQVEQQIQEMQVLSLNIGKLGKEKEKEILAPVGRGIFSKAELKEDKFFVNVGCGIFLKKNGDEASKIVNNQIEKLRQMKIELIEIISNINSELEKVVQEAQKEKS